MAGLQKQEDDENLVDVGDEDEVETEVLLETEDENPNVVDQLEAVPAEDEEDEEELKPDTRTPEEKMKDYLEGDDELKEYYSKEVNKRIGKMTYDLREMERQRDSATEYARNVQTENAELKTKQQHQDGVFINEHKGRLEAQLEAAKKSYQEAHEAGDPSLIADANALIARTSAELSQAEQTETRFERFVKTNKTPQEELVPYQVPPDPNAPAAKPQVDPKAEAWAERNSWFGEDENLTQAALSIHNTLVTQEGYLPTGNGYYAELDNRLRKNFPDKFNGGEKPEPPEVHGQQVVTPSSTATSAAKPRGKKSVRLSPSEVAVAKKLGVPLEEYAKYVVR